MITETREVMKLGCPSQIPHTVDSGLGLADSGLFHLFGCGSTVRALHDPTGNLSLRGRIAELEQSNKSLADEKSKLSSPAYVEKIAREELGLVKPGEVPYIP